MNETTVLLPHIKLRLNIKHPSFEECYAYGYECATAQLLEEDNPYPLDTSEYEHWQNGWWDGFYGVKPLFSLTEALTDEEALVVDKKEAANDKVYQHSYHRFINILMTLGGALVATVVVGYQVFELVA